MDVDVLFKYGLQGVVAYGAVGAISLLSRNRFKKDLNGDVKLYLMIAIAFAVGFVPADLGNFIANELKRAIAVGFGLNTLNTWVNKLGAMDAPPNDNDVVIKKGWG